MTPTVSLILTDTVLVSGVTAPVYPYTKPANEVFIDALNAKTGLNFGYTELTLGQPRVVLSSEQALKLFAQIGDASTDDVSLTSLELTPGGLSVSGAVSILYHRVDWEKVFPTGLIYLEGDAQTTQADILAGLNEKLHTNFTLDELFLNAVGTTTDGYPAWALGFAPTSLLWIGMLNVTLVPAGHLGLLMQTQTLDGLLYPFNSAPAPVDMLDISYVPYDPTPHPV